MPDQEYIAITENNLDIVRAGDTLIIRKEDGSTDWRTVEVLPEAPEMLIVHVSDGFYYLQTLVSKYKVVLRNRDYVPEHYR